MICTVKPPGKSEYALTLDAEPRYSSAIFGGYETATINCRLDDTERTDVLGGRIRIHGTSGIVWQGIVVRRPSLTEPLIAQGWAWCGTFGRRAITYATATTTTAAVTDVLDDEIATAYLPAGAAYRAWIGTEATEIDPLDFTSCDANTKLKELTNYAAWCFGWYMEQVAGKPVCVPHWYARSTTPDYIARIGEAESESLDEAALDELVSAVRVNYSDAEFTAYYDLADTDATHPLVQLGITRYGELSIRSEDATVAASAAATYLAENGRAQVKGSMTTRYVYTTTGVPVYLPDLRPGKMLRLYGLPGGYVDTTIKRVSMAGDQVATLELDNEPYRLDIALANLGRGTSSGSISGAAQLGKAIALPHGAFAIRMVNGTGSATVKGTGVSCSTSADNQFVLQANEFDTIGVVYEGGVANGAEALVIISGRAQVLLQDAAAVTHGQILVASDTDGRFEGITNPGSGVPATETHFKECGHILQSNGGGTNQLVWAVIHFN